MDCVCTATVGCRLDIRTFENVVTELHKLFIFLNLEHQYKPLLQLMPKQCGGRAYDDMKLTSMIIA